MYGVYRKANLHIDLKFDGQMIEIETTRGVGLQYYNALSFGQL